MSDSTLGDSAAAAKAGGRGLSFRDPRIWFGIFVTVAAIAFTLRDISFAEVGAAIGKANLAVLLAVAIPANVASLWVRAFRWKHLAAHVAPVTAGAAYRATAIGYLVNNLLPLRIGEVVRAWVLARESGGATVALFGTVVLERVIDLVVLMTIAFLVLGQVVDLGPLMVIAVIPIVGIGMLKWWPDRLLGWASSLGHLVLPGGLADTADRLLRELSDGLGGLGGGRRLAAVVGWSAVLWGVVVPLTFWGPILALPMGLSGPIQEVFASYVSMLYVAVAVAIPSAPGFFGVYHAACREALAPLGVSADLALAMGTLSHVVFWLTFVVCGALALRSAGTRLGDVLSSAQADPTD